MRYSYPRHGYLDCSPHLDPISKGQTFGGTKGQRVGQLASLIKDTSVSGIVLSHYANDALSRLQGFNGLNIGHKVSVNASYSRGQFSGEFNLERYSEIEYGDGPRDTVHLLLQNIDPVISVKFLMSVHNTHPVKLGGFTPLTDQRSALSASNASFACGVCLWQRNRIGHSIDLRRRRVLVGADSRTRFVWGAARKTLGPYLEVDLKAIACLSSNCVSAPPAPPLSAS